MLYFNVIIMNTIEIKKNLALPVKYNYHTACWKPVTLYNR